MQRALTVLMLAAASAPVAAQRDVLAVRLRAEAGPVANAVGVLTCRPLHELSALTALPATPRFMIAPGRRVVHATSDKRGILRFAGGGAEGLLAGSGLVTTAGGLGALIVDLQPGRSDELPMVSMAAIASATGGEKITVFARALLPTGRTVVLPPEHGNVVLLPPGTYDAWVHGDRGWVWQRLTLVSGQTVHVAFDGDARTLRSPGSYVHPEGRPEVDLLAGRDRTVLLGSDGGGARGASFVAWTDRGVFGPQAVAAGAASAIVDWPQRGDAAPQTLGPVPTGVPRGKLRLFGVARSASGDWQVRACSSPTDTPAGPAFVLPQAPGDDAWLLFVAEGHAPQAAPWTHKLDKLPFELQRGFPLRIAARDGSGEPVVDLAVEYVPADMPAASVAGHTDHRGESHLGNALGPGVLRISDARFANTEIPLDNIPIDGVQVKVTAGETLRGTATWDDGKPAARVVVELRDPRGVLRPAVRTVVTGDDGSFTFTGLPPPEVDLVLFAGAVREHRTWSAKLDRVRGGGTETLVLKNEDPQLGPQDPGKRR